MNRASEFKQQLAHAVAVAATSVSEDGAIDAANVLERPRDESHGDFSCPLPLMLAKKLRRAPREIAEQITAALTPPPFIARTDIAAPGFINFTIADEAKTQVVGEILTTGTAYGRHDANRHGSKKESLLLEFVSANPTGPLHVGHGRACAYGDALGNILEAAGVDVRREYYVNNAGRQMDILAASVWLRHWLTQRGGSDGGDNAMPAGAYRGDYLIAAAEKLAPLLRDTQAPAAVLANDMTAATDSDAAANLLVAAAQQASKDADTFAALRRQIGDLLLDDVIKRDMQALRVDTDGIDFYPETRLHEDGSVADGVRALQERGQLYEQDGALWFNSSAFGDEKDRVVRRANGDLTYFAADIAYHANKLSRDRPPDNDYKIINVLGADHHGYVPRLSAAMQALGFAAEAMETEIIQFVALYENGERVKMSTRAGEFITLRELIEAVGADAARYYYLNRKNDQHLDFDMTAAKAQERKNPIYYINYANARINSVMLRWREDHPTVAGGDVAALKSTDTAPLARDEAAVRLCAGLMAYPALVQRAAKERAPHLLTNYLHDTAALLHNFYESCRIFPQQGQPAQSAAERNSAPARLALLAATAQVLANCAGLLGLQLPEKM